MKKDVGEGFEIANQRTAFEAFNLRIDESVGEGEK